MGYSARDVPILHYGHLALAERQEAFRGSWKLAWGEDCPDPLESWRSGGSPGRKADVRESNGFLVVFTVFGFAVFFVIDYCQPDSGDRDRRLCRLNIRREKDRPAQIGERHPAAVSLCQPSVRTVKEPFQYYPAPAESAAGVKRN